MNYKQKEKYLVIGALIAALVTAGMIPAIAAGVSKTIQVSTGVTIYVDDVKLEPKDGNGNPIEAFIYNGTTYLPVKAIGQAYGKDVQWEGKTSSVYVGKHVSDEPNVLLAELDYFSSGDYNSFYSKSKSSGYESSKEKDNLGNMHKDVVYGYFDRTYILDGRYSKMTGTLYQVYDRRDSTEERIFEVYGDGRLIYEGKMMGGEKPLDFNINLTGVLEMKIVFGHRYSSHNAALGEVGLYH